MSFSFFIFFLNVFNYISFKEMSWSVQLLSNRLPVSLHENTSREPETSMNVQHRRDSQCIIYNEPAGVHWMGVHQASWSWDNAKQRAVWHQSALSNGAGWLLTFSHRESLAICSSRLLLCVCGRRECDELVRRRCWITARPPHIDAFVLGRSIRADWWQFVVFGVGCSLFVQSEV